jgi:hypothetical protein
MHEVLLKANEIIIKILFKDATPKFPWRMNWDVLYTKFVDRNKNQDVFGWFKTAIM